jgi:hypothetical protein
VGGVNEDFSVSKRFLVVERRSLKRRPLAWNEKFALYVREEKKGEARGMGLFYSLLVTAANRWL